MHECRATHVLWVIWDAKIDGNIHFYIGPEERSILDQTRSNKVKFRNSLLSYESMPILSSFVSRYQKFDSFYVRQVLIAKFLRQKMHFKKLTSSPLPVFFYHCSAKNEDIALKFSLCVVRMKLYNIYSNFWDNSKFLDFIGIYFRKIEIWSFGVKIETNI